MSRSRWSARAGTPGAAREAGCAGMAETCPLPVIALLITLMAAACAHAPARKIEGYTPAAGEKAAKTAAAQIGRPYKYQGETPAGFDCSGLVRYSYRAAGVDVPHGTRELLKVTSPVPLREARKGDLVFFDQDGKRFSHVGIYLGSGQFVHAPSTGGKVRTDMLNDDYWKKHFLDARSFR